MSPTQPRLLLYTALQIATVTGQELAILGLQSGIPAFRQQTRPAHLHLAAQCLRTSKNNSNELLEILPNIEHFLKHLLSPSALPEISSHLFKSSPG